MSTEITPAASADIHAPIGSIITWYFPDISGLEAIYKVLPSNWVLCDGSVLDGSHFRKLKANDVSQALLGKRVPDLTGRFVRGAGTAALDLTPMGAEATPLRDERTQSAGTHQHQFPQATVTGWIEDAEVSQADGNRAYRCWDDNKNNGGHSSAKKHLAVDAYEGDDTPEGQHRHTLSPASSTPSGDHFHQFTVPSLPTIPPCIGLWFIIRIK